MELDTFETHIDSVICSRGREYYRTGRIGDVEEIAPGLFHASADGTTRYDVDVRMKGERIVSAACSCPYDRGPYCKHMVAVFMKIRDKRRVAEGSAGPESKKAGSGEDAFPHETYDRVLAYLVDKHARGQDATASTRRKQSGARRAPALSLAAAADEIESGLLRFQGIWDDRWSRSGRYSYEDNGIAMEGVGIVSDNVECCDDDAQACLLALLALGYVIDFIGHWDDSDGIAGDAMERLESLLADRCDALAEDPRAICRLQVAHALVAAADNPAYGGWGVQAGFLSHAAELVERRDDARFVLDAIERFEKRETFDARMPVVAHYRLLEKLGDKKAVRAFEKAHALHPFFFIEKLEDAFLGHDMDAARKLLVRKTGWGKEHGTMVRHASYTDWSLPHEVFPNGYYTYLEAVFEEQHDREGLFALYRRDVGDGRVGVQTLGKLRRLAGDAWPAERDRIIDEAISTGRNTGVAEQLIREDSLAEAALRYCRAEPRDRYRYFAGGQERIVRFYRLVGESYPDEARELLRELVASKSQRAGGRGVYREICGVIQCYQSLFGTDDARAIVTGLRERYPRRRSLMAELDALEGSW